MARTTGPRVEFAQAVRSIRPPREDELSVMRHFANHAARCSKCSNAYATYMAGGELCDKGHSLARDVAVYIYSKGGKPFSIIDRENGEYTEVEIPASCTGIRDLVRAINKGLSLSRRRKVVINQQPQPRSPTTHYVTVDSPTSTSQRHRYFDREDNANVIEVIPGSNRHDRKERERYSTKESDRRRQPGYTIDSKGSLYRRDEEAKQARKRWEEEPVIIYAEPRRPHRRS